MGQGKREAAREEKDKKPEDAMQSAADYLAKMHLEELILRKTEGEARFAFMLRDRQGDWSIEDRYRTEAELDYAVECFAEEFRQDNDGYAPLVGKDFLAVTIHNYQLLDAPTEPDYEAEAEYRRETQPA